jgi:hypothetical protein
VQVWRKLLHSQLFNHNVNDSNNDNSPARKTITSSTQGFVFVGMPEGNWLYDYSQLDDQVPISARMGASARPLSVKEYSIRTGISGYTSLRTIPSCSSSFSRSDSSLPLMFGREASKAQNLLGPFNSWNTMSETQRLLSIPTAFSKRGHIAVSFILSPQWPYYIASALKKI